MSWRVRLQGLLWLRAEIVRRGLLAVACLVQMVTVRHPLLARVAPVSLPMVCDQVCLLDRVKLPALPPRPEPLHPRQLLVAGSRLRARPRQLVEERFWDSQS